MAEADKFAESVRRATYGRETRVPIVSAIEFWLGSAERIRRLISKMIDNNLNENPDREAWLQELDILKKEYPKHVTAIRVTPIATADYYTLVITRKNGS